MATLGVVPFSNTMTSSHSNKLQILQHSTNSVNNSGSGGHPERREILILRKKTKPVVCVSDSSETVLVAGNSSVAENNASRMRKKPALVSANLLRSHHQPPPVAVARRNARERNRVKQVNNGFATLRQHIPLSVSSTYSSAGSPSGGRSSKKLSKVETLRMAVDYIRSLQELLSMDDNDSNANIQASHSPHSSDASSPTSLTVQSPASPANSFTNPSVRDHHQGYQNYEDDSAQTDVAVSPILIDDEDDASLIVPASPSSSSNLTTPSYASQYHRIRGTNTFIQLVNSQPNIISNTENSKHYKVEESFAPIASSFPTICRDENYITSDSQLHRLQTHPLVTESIETYQEPSSNALVIVGSSRPHPTSSLSPGDYSEQSLSPETTNVDDIAMLRATTSSSTFLPSFSATMNSSPPTTALEIVTSPSAMQIISSPTTISLNSTSVIHHQTFPVNAELLSHVKMEGRLGDGEVVPEGVIASNSQEMMDMMAWWEHEQKLRLVTSVATSSS